MDDIQPAHIYKQIVAIIRLARRAYRPYRSEIFLLTALGFAGGILGGIGINAAIPLLTFMLGIQSPATDTFSRMIQNVFAFLHIPFVPKFLLSFIVIAFIGKTVVQLLLTYVQIRITTKYERDTRSKLFSKVLRSSWPYLLRQKLGNLETLLMVDTTASVSLFVKISFLITILTSLLMYLVVAFSISALITTCTFVLGVLVFVLLRPFLNRVHALSRERTVVYRDILHLVSEHIGGIKTVKALAVEGHAIERGERLFRDTRTFSQRIQIFQQIAIQAVTPIGIIYIAGILALAFKTPFISLAALPAILYLIYQIFMYIQQVQNTLQYMSELAPHLERVVSFEENFGEQREVSSGSLPFTFERELVLNNVSFSYENGRDILHGVSFTVPKGQMVGIVGPSGAGKTTCVDLMLRLLGPTGGAISLDGVAAHDIDLAQWRRRIAYVSQDLFVMHDTIRNNIRFYDDSISDEEIWQAARQAHIDGFIRECPEGLDTFIGDRGVSVSAGEKQRIVIARSLARKPELLILDEATSALDNEAEVHIKRVIQELKGRVTIVAIAHRLSTIIDSDHLIVLQDGRVVEEGSPKKLLGDTGSYFYKVYSINA